jgi:hypothetical protein
MYVPRVFVFQASCQPGLLHSSLFFIIDHAHLLRQNICSVTNMPLFFVLALWSSTMCHDTP